MSTEDTDTPALDLSSPEDREAILAEALAHAAMQEAQYRQPLDGPARKGVWKTPLAIVVFVLAGYLLAFPPPWLAGDPLPSIDAGAQVHGVRSALFLQAQQIEAFRVSEGRLPDSLGEMDRVVPGVRYVRSGSRAFQLVASTPAGTTLIYDSSRPLGSFGSVASAWGIAAP